MTGWDYWYVYQALNISHIVLSSESPKDPVTVAGCVILAVLVTAELGRCGLQQSSAASSQRFVFIPTAPLGASLGPGGIYTIVLLQSLVVLLWVCLECAHLEREHKTPTSGGLSCSSLVL